MQTTQTKPTVFNPVQLHLLQMFSRTKDDQTLQEVQQLLTEYFAKKVEQEMNDLWDKGLWNDEKNEDILKMHLRTPYETKNSLRH